MTTVAVLTAGLLTKHASAAMIAVVDRQQIHQRGIRIVLLQLRVGPMDRIQTRGEQDFLRMFAFAMQTRLLV